MTSSPNQPYQILRGDNIGPVQTLHKGDKIGFLTIFGPHSIENSRDGNPIDYIMRVQCSCGKKFTAKQRRLTSPRYQPNIRSCMDCRDNEQWGREVSS